MGSTLVINLVLWFLLLPAGGSQGTQGQSYTTTHSPHGNLNLPCQNCHTASGWKPIRAVPEFDHNQTRYPLRGMHEGVACTQCHIKPVFTNVGQRCADCHADLHRGQFGSNCEQCHSVKGWTVAIQQINQHQNRFPLLGAHAALECDSCHKGAATGQFQGLSTECYSCHGKDYQNTNNPAHVAAGFSSTCEQCHTMDNWVGVNFDHLKFTGFALVGAHATLQCSQCHLNNQFKGTPASCVGCHLKDFQNAKNPDHVAGNFPQTCQQCHTSTAWVPATFDHNTVGFPLTGFHATSAVTCAMCHKNNNYSLGSADATCVACHLNDYKGTSNPNHTQMGFAQTCDTCHNTNAWMPAQFNHAASAFPLTGAHASVQCAQCHQNNNFNIQTTTCVSCHLKDYQGTGNPPHAAANFSQTCQQCHTTAPGWGGATWSHASTGWALTGGHLTIATCVQCHVGGNYTLGSANTSCASGCHLNDYNNTTTPPHAAASFPQTCDTCHTTAPGWGGSSWSHANTGWALTGYHLSTATCVQCHIGGNYSLGSANTSCASGCHLKDYQGTANPPHASAGFPQTCDTCHDTIQWTDAIFSHANTGFPLTGYHANPAVTCVMCHINNNYSLTSGTCSNCHMTDFNNTTNPVHSAAGFPNTCDTCHNTTAWIPLATFPTQYHTMFPLNHGNANGVCASCHQNANDFTVFQCTNCHGGGNPNNFSHPQVNGYVYNSINCYQCHKNGGGG